MSHIYTQQMPNNLWISTHSLSHVQKEHVNAFKGVLGGVILCEVIPFCVLAAKKNMHKTKHSKR